MDNPILLVEHVYEVFITKYRLLMRDGQLNQSDQKVLECLGKKVDDVKIFFHLYAESSIPLNGKPLHNKYINLCTPQDASGIYTPSRLYIFINVTQCLDVFQADQVDDSSKECAIRIYFLHNRRDKIVKSLLSSCSKICHNQTVTDLLMEKVTCLDLETCNVFHLSRNAKMVWLDNCSLPTAFLSNLLSQLSVTSEMSRIYLTNTNVGNNGYYLAEAFNKWGTNSRLMWLGLWNCFMPVHVWCEVLRSLSQCFSLKLLHLSSNMLGAAGMDLAKTFGSWRSKPRISDLSLKNCYIPMSAWDKILKYLHKFENLVNLDLSENILGEAATQLAESIREWGQDAPLEYFSLTNCCIPNHVSGLILKHLSVKKSLNFVNLNDNHLTGCLSKFCLGYEEGMCSLKHLCLAGTSLNKEDINHLSSLMEAQKLPALASLHLHENNFSTIKEQLKRLITVCDIHHQRELEITLDDLYSEDTKIELQHFCKASKLSLSFCKQEPITDQQSLLTGVGLTPTKDVICIKNCNFSRKQNSSTLQCLQLCKKLSVLDLTGTILELNAMAIVKAIRSWKPDVTLKELILNDCKIAPSVCSPLLQVLSVCKHLTHLDLSGYTIESHGHHLVTMIETWGSKSLLTVLDLSHCVLPLHVCGPLLTALGHCEMITSLWLPGNTLTGCLSNFLCGQNSKLSYLEEIFVSYTKLNQTDLLHFRQLIYDRKLPQLSELDLGGNHLYRMEDKLEEFIFACVAHHQRELKLNVWFNHLSTSFEFKCQRHCQGTRIILCLEPEQEKI